MFKSQKQKRWTLQKTTIQNTTQEIFRTQEAPWTTKQREMGLCKERYQGDSVAQPRCGLTLIFTQKNRNGRYGSSVST